MSKQLIAAISNARSNGFPFYVYTLADAGGVFYVGKGSGRRLLHHERLSPWDTNVGKKTRIIAAGADLRREAVAFFRDAGAAFAYETELIASFEGLTNLASGARSAFERAQDRARDLLARMVPFDRWQPPAAVLRSFGDDPARLRELYDSVAQSLHESIECPCPVWMEFDPQGRLAAAGYAEDASAGPLPRWVQ